MMSNDELNAALEALPGERVTPQYMDGRIARVEFQVLPKSTVTICNITLDNGYSVRGESACVDPANFDRAIGEKIAYDNAYRQLWPLFGFLLAEGRFRGGRNREAEADMAARFDTLTAPYEGEDGA